MTSVVDVRTVPSSGRYPWFKKDALSQRLTRHNIGYRTAGHALGGRPKDPALFCEGVADYEAMAKTPAFRTAIDRLADEAKTAPGPRLPDVRRARAARLPPLPAGRPGAVGTRPADRPHPERRQHRAAPDHRGAAAHVASQPDLFSTDMAEWLASAYRSRARAVAFKAE